MSSHRVPDITAPSKVRFGGMDDGPAHEVIITAGAAMTLARCVHDTMRHIVDPARRALLETWIDAFETLSVSDVGWHPIQYADKREGIAHYIRSHEGVERAMTFVEPCWWVNDSRTVRWLDPMFDPPGVSYEVMAESGEMIPRVVEFFGRR